MYIKLTYRALADCFKMGNKVYLPIEIWDDIPINDVQFLPHNINGKKIFCLPFNPLDRMASTIDGRPWQKYVVSKRKDFHGLRRLAKCKGSYKCLNNNCSYLKEFNESNRHHFKGIKCVHCKLEGELVACEVRKIWEFYDNNKVRVYHYGNHSCVCKPLLDTATTNNIIDQFKDNPKLKPCQLASTVLCKAMTEGKWDKLDEISMSLVDVQKTNNLKKKALKEIQPHGHSLEAVSILKTATDKRDKFLIYQLNDRKFNGEPTFVFKTSEFKLKLIKDMDRFWR
ncbi:uncharacterized protein LOC130641555 [Hydractinia symbiolongicarpus]|uniref:uncharacterized protein LOC130641555 n=1 Tax=Hydractinia symbiolongicarpus TaxID=13093 RepID=UPI002549CDEB|nr:uncharacterized protein LOC130641555 [Hydractinia symbiolongicarpus]